MQPALRSEAAEQRNEELNAAPEYSKNNTKTNTANYKKINSTAIGLHYCNTVYTNVY